MSNEMSNEEVRRLIDEARQRQRALCALDESAMSDYERKSNTDALARAGALIALLTSALGSRPGA